MASATESGPLEGAKLAYVVLYVADVDKAAKWYTDVFGFTIRREDKSRRWAELETGATTLAFTPLKQHETDITGGVKVPIKEDDKRPNIEISISVFDVNATMQRSEQHGATILAKPEPKEWGQTIGYVRDPDGITIRVGSHVAKC